MRATTSDRSAPAAAVPAPSSMPPTPTSPLRLPTLAAPLDPGTYGTGRFHALREALGTRTKVMLVLGPTLHGLDWEKRAHVLVRALNPSAKVLARGEDTLTPLMKERGELPQFSRPQAGPPDLFGQPTIIPKDYFLQTEWMGQARKLHGAEVGIWLDTVRLDAQREQAFRQQTSGGCALARDEFDAALTEERAQINAFLSWAQSELAYAFASEVAATSRQARAALAKFAGSERTRQSFHSEDDYQQYRCGRLTQSFIEAASECRGAHCVGQPTLVLEDGVWMASPRPEVPIPRDCADRLGHDWVADIDAAALRVARQVQAKMPASWLKRVAAIAAMDELGSALQRACAPARGRASAKDTDDVRQALRDQLAELGTLEIASGDGWREERVERFLKARGPAVQLARFEIAAATALVSKARDLLKPLSRRRCASRLNLPVAVVLVDIGTSETLFFDYFFEEEILCDEP